jgi:amino acid adenylation domain-containing protein
MLVNHFLEHSAKRLPHKTALVFEGARLSYAELDACANRLANALIGGGVGRGDRVAIFLDNGVEAVIAIFGALKANAIFSVINPTTKTDKLGYVLQDLEPRAVITHAAKLKATAPAYEQASSVGCFVVVGTSGPELGNRDIPYRTWSEVMATESDTPTPSRGIDLDLATIIYTSGSTGTPKGVMCTHRSMIAVATSIAEYLESVEEDVMLNVLQLAFGYGLYQMFVAFAVGATLVLERGFVFPYKVLDLMQREGVTGLAGVPTIFSLLLGLKDLKKHPLPKLRYITNAGGGMPANRIVALRDALAPAKLYSMYGQTECQRVCYLAPEEIDRRPGSVGKAIPNTEVCIVDENGYPVGSNVVGELVVRGSHVMSGYWKAPEKSAQRFRPASDVRGGGFGLPGETVLFTNDLFTRDEAGFLYFVSRTDDIIKSRGEKVAPKEIEQALYLFEGVQDAAAVGVPDPLLGQAIKVCVVAEPGAELNERALREHCKRHLEDVMLPKYIEILPELPKGPTGKIDKRALVEAFAGEPVAV